MARSVAPGLSVLCRVLDFGEVQAAFNIKSERRFVIAVKNSEVTSPPGVGLEDERQPDFPRELWARFGDRRWMSVDPPEFLDYERTELE